VFPEKLVDEILCLLLLLSNHWEHLPDFLKNFFEIGFRGFYKGADPGREAKEERV
jgi:hypothetical protein